MFTFRVGSFGNKVYFFTSFKGVPPGFYGNYELDYVQGRLGLIWLDPFAVLSRREASLGAQKKLING